MRARRAVRERRGRAERASCSARRSGRAPYIQRPRTRRGAPCAVSVLRECRSRARRCRRRPASSSPAWSRMPFISKDWRSPGEEWVKTVEGWEKKKILECANNKTLSLLLRYVIVPRFPPSPVSLRLALLSSLFVRFAVYARRTAVIPAFTSIRLTAPFVYMRARTVLLARGHFSADSISFARTRRDATSRWCPQRPEKSTSSSLCWLLRICSNCSSVP